MRLTLASEVQKWEFLKRINAQKIEGVFARLDLNKEEQEKDFQLRSELRELRQKNPENKYKITSGKIIKVRQ